MLLDFLLKDEENDRKKSFLVCSTVIVLLNFHRRPNMTWLVILTQYNVLVRFESWNESVVV